MLFLKKLLQYWGLELRAYTLSHCTSPLFVMSFFKIGSHELFSLAGLEPKSS
jgi:hypothetical protein